MNAQVNTTDVTAAKQAKKPGKPKVLKAQDAMGALAATLVATPVQGASSGAADASPAAVTLRGQGAVGTVQIKPGMKYRTKAQHNLEWWNKMASVLDSTGMGVPVGELTKAGVPAHFIGYCLRRGYLTPTT